MLGRVVERKGEGQSRRRLDLHSVQFACDWNGWDHQPHVDLLMYLLNCAAATRIVQLLAQHASSNSSNSGYKTVGRQASRLHLGELAFRSTLITDRPREVEYTIGIDRVIPHRSFSRECSCWASSISMHSSNQRRMRFSDRLTLGRSRCSRSAIATVLRPSA